MELTGRTLPMRLLAPVLGPAGGLLGAGLAALAAAHELMRCDSEVSVLEAQGYPRWPWAKLFATDLGTAVIPRWARCGSRLPPARYWVGGRQRLAFWQSRIGQNPIRCRRGVGAAATLDALRWRPAILATNNRQEANR